MLITVIVPYKNAAKYIGRCIESLRIQKGEFEFILVNDNSDDRSKFEALTQTENDYRFKLIDNQRSPGVSGARNTGIDIAGGEWISFLDVDDVLLPGAYKKFTAAIDSIPGANMIQFNHVRYYTTKKVRIIKQPNKADRYQLPYLPNWWFGVWNKIYKAEFVKGIRFNESLQYGEDGLFIIDCMANGAFLDHATKCVTTVEHIFENKQSLSHIKTSKDIIKYIRVYFDYLNDHSNPDLRLFLCKQIAELLNDKHVQKVICDAKV